MREARPRGARGQGGTLLRAPGAHSEIMPAAVQRGYPVSVWCSAMDTWIIVGCKYFRSSLADLTGFQDASTASHKVEGIRDGVEGAWEWIQMPGIPGVL